MLCNILLLLVYIWKSFVLLHFAWLNKIILYNCGGFSVICRRKCYKSAVFNKLSLGWCMSRDKAVEAKISGYIKILEDFSKVAVDGKNPDFKQCMKEIGIEPWDVAVGKFIGIKAAEVNGVTRDDLKKVRDAVKILDAMHRKNVDVLRQMHVIDKKYGDNVAKEHAKNMSDMLKDIINEKTSEALVVEGRSKSTSDQRRQSFGAYKSASGSSGNDKVVSF